MSYHPNNELVAVAWLRAVLPAVSTALPTDETSWSADGFVTVESTGGSPDNYVGWRRPVISLDCWAAAPDSGRPPWNKASQLAEQVRAAILDHGSVGRAVTLPAAYAGARVETVFMTSEPRRVQGDVSSYAHYQMDVTFWWKEIGS